jgi:hypothetical protein
MTLAFPVDGLTLFGLASVTAGLVCYALEARGRGFVLGFAAANACAAAYGFLQGAWPFGLVEVFWTGAALVRWRTGSPTKPQIE